MSRKRRRESFYDDDEDNSVKRDRPDRDTTESLIYRIGSKDTDKIQKDISELCLLICAEITKNPEHFVRVFVNCAKNIPERASIYANILGLINLKNHPFVSQFVEHIVRDLKDALKACQFDDAKYLVRFISYLVSSNVVNAASLLGLYENFAEVTIDVRASSQSRTDWYSYIVLYALPYSVQCLAEYNATSLDAILNTINVYLSKRQTLHVPMLRVWDNDDPHPQEDYLSCLWSQISTMAAANWRENVLVKINDLFPALRESGQACAFSQITPPDYDPEIVYPLPHVIFQMFDYTDVYSADDDEDDKKHEVKQAEMPTSKTLKAANLPGAHTIERFLVNEQLHIILETMHFNRIMCARALLTLSTRANVALDYMIVEAIFADIFRLPKPPVQHGNLLFYSSLLIQLCNEAPNTMPLVLAQATETLFERLDSMKPVCIAKFVEWFSFHLTNYQLHWSWRDWSRALEEPTLSPRRWFISETLRRLIRYSYYDNVKQRLPREFHSLLPPEPIPVNPYATASASKSRMFSQVMDAFHDRRSPEGLLDLITRITTGREDDSDNEFNDDQSPKSAHQNSPSKHRVKSNSCSPEKNESASDDDPMSPESKQGKANRTHITARRRIKSQSKAVEGNKEEDDDSVPVDDPLLRSEATAGRNASPPRCDDGETGGIEGASLCLVPGVTSRGLELFTTALLYRAHKTISHTCSLFKRYADTFKSLAPTVELQVESLHILQAVWINQSQMVVVISDYMCRNGLLDPEAVVRWAFSPYMSYFKVTEKHSRSQSSSSVTFAVEVTEFQPPRILQLHVWECLFHTLIRVGERVAQINPKLNAAKDSLELQHHRSASRSSASSANAEEVKEDDEDRRRRSNRGRRGSPSPHNDRHRDHNIRKHSSDSDRSGGSSSPHHHRHSRSHHPSSTAAQDRVARLKEAQCEAVRSQCAVITLLLHRHVRLIDLVTESISGSDSQMDGNEQSMEELHFINFWLKGRLMQTVLEHQDQLLPYMENLEELMSDGNPFVRDVFQALRSLYA